MWYFQLLALIWGNSINYGIWLGEKAPRRGILGEACQRRSRTHAQMLYRSNGLDESRWTGNTCQEATGIWIRLERLQVLYEVKLNLTLWVLSSCKGLWDHVHGLRAIILARFCLNVCYDYRQHKTVFTTHLASKCDIFQSETEYLVGNNDRHAKPARQRTLYQHIIQKFGLLFLFSYFIYLFIWQ